VKWVVAADIAAKPRLVCASTDFARMPRDKIAVAAIATAVLRIALLLDTSPPALLDYTLHELALLDVTYRKRAGKRSLRLVVVISDGISEKPAGLMRFSPMSTLAAAAIAPSANGVR
jgi:hypothetical protein